ncbi:MAG TPA: histidinol dehydrogenase [Firmicutes bacterium]|nr:histidinol dehydrogenase [Bacillota bacterium]
MRIVNVKDYKSLEEVRKLVTRPHLDQVEVSEAAMERTKQIFGRPLSPQEAVAKILADIEQEGDQALLRYIATIDGQELDADGLFVSTAEFAQAETLVSPEFKTALAAAIDNVHRYHQKQVEQSWFAPESDGIILGQKITPLERVGIYVPGGNAPLISTVVMSAIPAQVAGVEEIIMATPLRDGVVDPHLLVAAKHCGVRAVLKAGGAQAIAALSYGTETVPRVDKVVGPGNLYVSLAKKMVYGRVGIEAIAGPSEILIIADDSASPDYVAADLLSQAEHDWEASAALITPSYQLAQQVELELTRQLQDLSTAGIAATALERWGLIVITKDMDQAVELANIFAPEHLELLVEAPWDYLGKIKHAGAIFLGKYATEPIGDYIAGPNHILPTNGTARFSSPLTTHDFVKRSSVIYYTETGLEKYGKLAVEIANREGLAAHARAIQIRLEDLQEGEQNG